MEYKSWIIYARNTGFDLDARHRAMYRQQLNFGGWGGRTLVEYFVLQLLLPLLVLILSKGEEEPLCNDDDEPHFFVLYCFLRSHMLVTERYHVFCSPNIQSPIHLVKKFGGKGFLWSRHYFSTPFWKNPHLAVEGVYS